MKYYRRHSAAFLSLLLLLLLPLASSIRLNISPKQVVSLKKSSFVDFSGKKAFRGGSSISERRHEPNEKDHGDDTPEKKGHNLIVSKHWCRVLYMISALNPFLAVLFNDYKKMLEFFPQPTGPKPFVAKTYETLFFFAKLKPRVSFAIGAMLRALQLTTAFQYVLDPTSGVGFGLNLICLFAKSRWPACIVLGWSLTKPMWKILGACPPSGLPVPITVSWKTPKDAPVATKGYRIGL